MIKEKDAIVFILSEKDGVLKLFSKSSFLWSSKNLSLLQPGTIGKFWLITDFQRLKLVSGLPIKLPGSVFQKYPYHYLYTLRLIKIFSILETPKELWQRMINLEFYLQENIKTFLQWFIVQFLKDLGFALDFKYCQCGNKIKTAFLDKGKLVCFQCKKIASYRLSEKDLWRIKQLNSEKPPKVSLPKETNLILKTQLKNAKLSL